MPDSQSLSNKDYTVALVGPPNVGKSFLFNRLTGLSQKIGNYPGTTTEKKYGRFKFLSKSQNEKIQIVDVPGLLSLEINDTKDIKVVHEILQEKHGKVDSFIFVVNSVNLDRDLLLVQQVIKKYPEKPRLLLLNFTDELISRSGEIDVQLLENILKTNALSISTLKNWGIAKVIDIIRRKEFLKNPEKINASNFPDFSNNSRPFTDSKKKPISEFFPQNELSQSSINSKKIASLVTINKLKSANLSKVLDGFFLNRFFGPLFFLLIFMLIFQSIFSYITPVVDLLDSIITWTSEMVNQQGNKMTSNPYGTYLVDFLANGLIAGVGSAIIFLPQIVLLLFFIGILEYTGFMARASLVTDRFMQYIGLQGRSFLPLLSSYACAVPGIIATRSIKSSKERLITIFISPFMTCSARLPVYILLVGAFIPNKQYFYGLVSLPTLVFISLYLLGLIVAFITSYGLKWILKSKNNTNHLYIQELPPYRLPNVSLLFSFIYLRTKVFLKTAGTIILIVSIVLWFFLNAPFKKVKNDGIDHSYAAKIGQFFEPASQHIGFDWKINIGIISSLAAREVVVSTLALIYHTDSEDEETLKAVIRKQLNFASAMSLLIFFVFSLQCISTMAVAKRELGSWNWVIVMFLYMQTVAICASFVVYKLASSFSFF